MLVWSDCIPYWCPPLASGTALRGGSCPPQLCASSPLTQSSTPSPWELKSATEPHEDTCRSHSKASLEYPPLVISHLSMQRIARSGRNELSKAGNCPVWGVQKPLVATGPQPDMWTRTGAENSAFSRPGSRAACRRQATAALAGG